MQAQSKIPGGNHLVLILALVPALFAIGLGSEQQLWTWKEPNVWSLEDAAAILWNSPWAQEQRFRFYNSRRNIRQIT